MKKHLLLLMMALLPLVGFVSCGDDTQPMGTDEDTDAVQGVYLAD